MIKKYYLVVWGFAMPLATNAQQVVSTSGGNMTNNAVQANWTIGEPITETLTNSKTAVTSGFNQPTIKILSSIENIKNKINVSVFPNPTFQYVNVKYDGQLPISAKVLSFNGTVLSIIELKDQITQLDFSKNVSGVYIIKITDKSGKLNTYRIVKQ